MQKTRNKPEQHDEEPRQRWVATVAELGEARIGLRAPLMVTMEDFGDEIVASYPEVEAFGAGSTEADAINALKDQLAGLYFELSSVPSEKLGEKPLRWKRALCSVAHPTGF